MKSVLFFLAERVLTELQGSGLGRGSRSRPTRGVRRPREHVGRLDPNGSYGDLSVTFFHTTTNERTEHD